jgi:hypothetical protein
VLQLAWAFVNGQDVIMADAYVSLLEWLLAF